MLCKKKKKNKLGHFDHGIFSSFLEKEKIHKHVFYGVEHV